MWPHFWLGLPSAVTDMRIDVIDIAGVPVLALLWVALAWTSSRSINAGRPLTLVQRSMLRYGVLWVLSGGYLMLGAIALFSLDFRASIALFFAWGGVLTVIAWRRHRRARAAAPQTPNAAQRRAHLRQGFAVAALLVSLVASTIEWGFVAEHQWHVLPSLLWSAGVAGSILLAYGNRRTTVIVTLRAYLVLLVIGAIAEQKAAGLIAAGIGAAVYFAVEKIWKKPQPPMLAE